MQAVLDLLPVAAFVVTYYAAGFYAATAVLMIAMLALLVVDYLRLRRIPPLHLLSAALVLTLGGTTLLLHDVRFLKWKPTVFLWLVAIAAIGSTWYGRAPLAQRLLQPMVDRICDDLLVPAIYKKGKDIHGAAKSLVSLKIRAADLSLQLRWCIEEQARILQIVSAGEECAIRFDNNILRSVPGTYLLQLL